MPKKKSIEAIKEQDFVTWVAPDGSIQISTLSEDVVMCLAFTKLMHKAGMGQSIFEMKSKGFTIHQVKLTIEPIQEIPIPSAKAFKDF